MSTVRYTFFLLSLVLFAVMPAAAQTDSSKRPAKVYLIRATGHSGSLTNMRAVVDDATNCRLKNNRYSIIYLQPGTHRFYATTFIAPRAKEALNVEVPMEAGKTYYLRMVRKLRTFKEELFFEEITANSAALYLEKLKEDTDCDH